MMQTNQSRTVADVFDPSKWSTSLDFTLNDAWKEHSAGNMGKSGMENDDILTYTYTGVGKNNYHVKRVNDMNENDILKTYMQKIDKDQSDLRQDIRESERRTTERMRHIEERMDERLNRIEDLIAKTNDAVDKKFDKIVEDNKNTKNWVIGVCLTTIVGIAAMVIAVIVT